MDSFTPDVVQGLKKEVVKEKKPDEKKPIEKKPVEKKLVEKKPQKQKPQKEVESISPPDNEKWSALSLFDIAANMSDERYSGEYNGKQVHANDF